MGVGVFNGRFDGWPPAHVCAAAGVAGCRVVVVAALGLATAFDPALLVPQAWAAVRRLNAASGRATS
jgi:hypothetical protein